MASLTPRDKRNLTLLGAAVLVLALVGLPVFVELVVSGNEDDNGQLREALLKVQEARVKVREWQDKKDAVVQRYARKAPQLPAFLDESARAQKLDVAQVTPRPDTPVGKGNLYTERRTSIDLKKAGMLPLSRFFETIEKSGFPVALAELRIRSRAGEPDKYDVSLSVAAYDRIEKAAASSDPNKDRP
jgi:general secretion pathway protein M